MNRKKRAILIVVPAFALLFEVSVWRISLHVRHVYADDRLIAAIKKNDVAGVIAALQAGADANAADNGETPPTTRGVLEQFLDRLRDPGQHLDNAPPTALQVLYRYSEQANPAILKALLDRGARPNIRFEPGFLGDLSPLAMESSLIGAPDRVRLLLEHGADPNYVCADGKAPLFFATDPIRIRLLVAHGANVNIKDPDGRTPLMDAAYMGEVERVSLLLQSGADANATDANGATALIYATTFDRPDVVRLLVQHGAKVDARDKAGWTALMFDCLNSGDSVACARFLLQHGADVNVRNSKGETVLMRAREHGNQDLVRLLKQHGAKE